MTTLILKRVFRFGYGSEDLEVQFRGLRVVAPAADVTLVPGIVGGFYEQLELDIFIAVAAKSSLVADVGGNIGVFACLAASQMVTGRVVSFEPVPSNVAYLRRNLDANQLTDRVEVVEQAVSDTIGTAPIYIADSIGTHSLASANAYSDAVSMCLSLLLTIGSESAKSTYSRSMSKGSMAMCSAALGRR